MGQTKPSNSTTSMIICTVYLTHLHDHAATDSASSSRARRKQEAVVRTRSALHTLSQSNTYTYLCWSDTWHPAHDAAPTYIIFFLVITVCPRNNHRRKTAYPSFPFSLSPDLFLPFSISISPSTLTQPNYDNQRTTYNTTTTRYLI